MVDGFPVHEGAADRPMQLRIDEELQNAARLNAEFAKACPDDPNAPVRTMLASVGRRPNDQALYPQLAAEKDAQAWLGTAAGDHTYRARVEWLLWFENVAPIDLAACWSHRVSSTCGRWQPKNRRSGGRCSTTTRSSLQASLRRNG